jgi:hypothetical protein
MRIVPQIWMSSGLLGWLPSRERNLTAERLSRLVGKKTKTVKTGAMTVMAARPPNPELERLLTTFLR